MTVFETGRRVILAAVTIGLLAPLTARAQGTPPQPGHVSQSEMAQQRLAMMRGTLKKEFGFSDAQADSFLQKAQTIGISYQEKAMALQKKYGASPPPAQESKRQEEIFAMMKEMGKRTNAALLAVATPAQRPIVEQKIAQEARAFRIRQAQKQQMLEEMEKQAAAKAAKKP